jgi:hypothetical protein
MHQSCSQQIFCRDLDKLRLLCLRIPTLYNAHLDYYEAVHRISDELRDVAVAHLIGVSLCKSL